jgi:hypothetical protein
MKDCVRAGTNQEEKCPDNSWQERETGLLVHALSCSTRTPVCIVTLNNN